MSQVLWLFDWLNLFYQTTKIFNKLIDKIGKLEKFFLFSNAVKNSKSYKYSGVFKKYTFLNLILDLIFLLYWILILFFIYLIEYFDIENHPVMNIVYYERVKGQRRPFFDTKVVFVTYHIIYYKKLILILPLIWYFSQISGCRISLDEVLKMRKFFE